MTDIKGEIISIGTELLLGQICNTNAMWLSDQLSAYGINIFYHTVVGDNVERVKRSFAQAQERSNFVIVTGGLGPTEDDMTREAFQDLSKLSLYEHEASLQKITQYFKNNKQKMTANNRKQALVFQSAKVLMNEWGMAPGMILNYEDTRWIFLPGVPREMKNIFSGSLSKYLAQLTNKQSIIKSKILRFIGIGEAELEDQLADLIKNQTNPTIAPLAQGDGVALRLTAKASSEEAALHMLDVKKEAILSKLSPYYYGEGEDGLSHVIVQLLRERNLTISSAESLTGGLFASQLISVAGASSVFLGSIVSYDTKIKENTLGVSRKTIKEAGVISEDCALEMARNVRKMMNSDLGISFTGVAGPKAIENQSVGRVYIGIGTESFEKVYSYTFNGDRNEIRKRAVLKAMEIIFKNLS